MATNGHGDNSATEKSYYEQKEDTERGGHRRKSSVKHGDRALDIIGDSRVSLTNEDVCFPFPCRLFCIGAVHPSILSEVGEAIVTLITF